MSVFGSYARYYDLLYKDKDYASEAHFVESLLAKYAPNARSILELGCGTGAHARLLAEKGFSLHGVDISEGMLEIAQARCASLGPEILKNLSFSQGNVCDCRIGREFDAVVSLFHVVSYQSTNAELYAMFETAALHLKSGGVFIFDYWYGPAVLTERPAVRVKRMESEEIRVTRIAEPCINFDTNCVDVNYHVYIHDKKTLTVEELHECHRMRYLFSTEVEMLAQNFGLKILESCEWLTGKQPSFDTWGVCTVLSK
jgi:SAM-dependent methyltransferase